MAAEIDSMLPQRKMSRYRSQRIHAASVDADNTPPVPIVPETVTTITRSRSRYRHGGARRDHDEPGVSAIPAVPALPAVQAVQAVQAVPAVPAVPALPGVQAVQAAPAVPAVLAAPGSPTAQSGARKAYSRANARPLRREASADNFSPPKQNHRVDSVTTLPSPPPQPQSRIDGPPASDQIRATKATEKNVGDERGKGKMFGLFKRKNIGPPVPNDEPRAEVGPVMDANGAAIIPGIDAPVSAVNAKERRVLLECGTYKMTYPVTPTTTSVDLIKSAATTMSSPVNVKSAVLLEYFGSVGVHRAIRRYEHIRDIMNSWDHDAQNSLLLIDPGTSSSETELGWGGVPKTKPGNVSWLLHYSQSPGKWDKRIVHLKRDGQITVQKDPKKIEDQLNVCHLSDFDIYTPTQEKIKKKIRPPKKHCFAIKSQQKSSMFENTTNFVHFFSVGDKTVSDDFYNTVQSWRSWYLANIMGEGTKLEVITPAGKTKGKTTAPAVQGHHRMDSVDSHYQLGTFTPLLDMDQFGGQQRNESATQAQQSAATTTSNHHQRHTQLADDEPLEKLMRRSSINGVKLSMDQRRPYSSHGRVNSQGRQHSKEIQRSTKHRPLLDLTLPHQRTSSEQDNAFTGEGLLAHNIDGQGDEQHGKGVIDGAHAQGPMLDVSEESSFVQGSLLHQVSRRQGPREPIIDRHRRQRSTKTELC